MPSKNVKRKKRPGKKGSPRATVKTIHHKPGAMDLAGSLERRILLSARAMQLKIRGYTYVEIANKLWSEFELEKVPPVMTVYDWTQSGFADALAPQRKEAVEYIEVFKARSEEIIRALFPFAADKFAVARTKMIDGECIEVIDEKVLEERIKAAQEIRKQGESVLKATGVIGPRNEGDTLSKDGMQMFVIQTVNNHIAKDGERISSERAQTVLELGAGDAIVDGL